MVPRPLCNIMCRRSCVTHAQFSWPGRVCVCVCCASVAPMTRPERTTCCKYSEKSSEQFMSALLLFCFCFCHLAANCCGIAVPDEEKQKEAKIQIEQSFMGALTFAFSPLLCACSQHTQPMSVFACIGKSIIRAKAIHIACR